MQSWTRPPFLPCPAVRTPSALRHGDPSISGRRRRGRPRTIYVCGITPYDATHLGHAATYLAFDLVQRVWLDNGHRVHYVQNITDIDDPLLERADRDGDRLAGPGGREIQLFREDMTALRVLPPEDYIGAVEAMDEVSAAVQRLLDAAPPTGSTTRSIPDVYFDIAAAPKFGYESRYDLATMLQLSAERGGDPDRAGQAESARPAALADASGGRAVLGVAGRAGSARLAHRMRGDRRQPARPDHRRTGRRQRSDLSAPRMFGGAHRGADRRRAVRPALQPCRDDLARGREDVEVPRQSGLRLQAAG